MYSSGCSRRIYAYRQHLHGPILSGSPPFPHEEKGELEGELVHYFSFPFLKGGGQGKVAPHRKMAPII